MAEGDATEIPPSAAWTAPATRTSAPAAAAATGGAPPRRSKAWLVILIAALAITVVAAVAGTVLFVDRSLPPLDGANDFLHDVAALRLTSAGHRLCAADRANPEVAIAGVRAHFANGKSFTVNPLSVDRDGGRAIVDYSVTSRGGGPVHSFSLPLREENGHWRACPG